MDGQGHTYEIVINKDELLIELSSDDVYFISKQMDKWFKILLDDSYVPVSIPTPPQALPAPPAQEEERSPQPPSLPPEQPQPTQQPIMSANDMSQVHLPHEMPSQQYSQQAYTQPVQSHPGVQPSVMPAPPPVENYPQPVQNYNQPQQNQAVQPMLPPVENSTPTPIPAAHTAPPSSMQPMRPSPAISQRMSPSTAQVQQQINPSAQPAAPLPQTESVPHPMASTPPGSGPEYYLPEPEEVSLPQEAPGLEAPLPAALVEQTEEGEGDFERVMDTLMEDLGESDATPFQEEADETITSLSELCKKGNASTSEDFMLFTAYYLTYFEAVENFSLKQLNSAMVKSGLTPVNHSVLEVALSKGFLSMVPDLTGTMNVTEYALSPEGQQYTTNLL